MPYKPMNAASEILKNIDLSANTILQHVLVILIVNMDLLSHANRMLTFWSTIGLFIATKQNFIVMNAHLVDCSGSDGLQQVEAGTH
jgi:hypothetical protein